MLGPTKGGATVAAAALTQTLVARLGTSSEDAASYVTGTHIPVDGGLNMTVAKDWQRFLNNILVE